MAHDTTPEPNVPIPPGATADRYWTSITPEGVWARGLVWSDHNTPKVDVSVCGQQRADDGSYTVAILMFGAEDELNAAEARALAAKLNEAADALDRLR